MLKGIDPLVSPPLMNALMGMGHGDEIVFADANFPAASHAQRLIHYSGQPLIDVLRSALTLMPLDYAVDFSAILMAPPDPESAPPAIWEDFTALLAGQENGGKPFVKLAKPEFYDRARRAYAIVATGERRRFSNIILRMGIVADKRELLSIA
ncbi:MAG: fucose isomerase [Candidatus Accumulibacter sp.]|jgi:L-fucose mutarotase|nr:fucose isomerase [Accumulibacter sp.]